MQYFKKFQVVCLKCGSEDVEITIDTDNEQTIQCLKCKNYEIEVED